MKIAMLLLTLAQDTAKDDLLRKLENQKITLDFKDVPLDDALGFVRDYANINIVVDSDVYAKLGEDQLRVSIKVKDLTIKSALRLLLGTRDLTMTYREGVLMVVSKEKANKSVTTRVYDVRDLLFKIQDFPGPRIELTAPSGNLPMAGVTITIEEEPKNVMTEDFITEIVKSNTGDGSWDENANASITLANGLLVVSQSKKAHGEIERLLNLLRQYK